MTVTVAEDAGSDEPQSVTLTHTVRGGDYLGVGSRFRDRDHSCRGYPGCA